MRWSSIVRIVARAAAVPCTGDLAAELVSVSERIDLPAVAPVVTQHQRLAIQCPTCGARVVAPVPVAARGTPFGPRLHAVATYLKTFQALSYERLQVALTDLAISILAAKRRSLDRQLGAILATSSGCDLTRALQAKIGCARDQLLIFLAHPGRVELTNNGSERLLRPSVVQRKMTNGYRAMWTATGEANIRTVVDTARLTGCSPFGTILRAVSA